MKVGNRLTPAQCRVLAQVLAGERTMSRLCFALDMRAVHVQLVLDALIRRNLIEPVAAFPEPTAYIPRPRAERILTGQA